MFCYICHALDSNALFNRDVVGICIEAGKPVCKKHAQGCVDDGHGFDPLPAGRWKPSDPIWPPAKID